VEVSLASWDRVVARAHELDPSEIGYIKVTDRTEPSEVSLARVDFDPDELAEWMSEDEGDDEYSALTEASLAWVEAQVEEAMADTDSAWRRFRVKWISHGGDRQLGSCNFVGAVAGREDDKAPPILMTSATPEDVAAQARAGAERDTAHLHRQFSELLLEQSKQMSGLFSTQLTRMQTDLTSSRGHLDSLMAVLLNTKTQVIEEAQDRLNAEEERILKDREMANRNDLMKSGMDRLGQIAEQALIGRNLDPGARALLGQVGGNPELLQALQDPALQALLQDPERTKVALGILRDPAVARVLNEPQVAQAAIGIFQELANQIPPPTQAHEATAPQAAQAAI